MVSASGISFNADDETGEIGAILLRQIDNGVRAALPHENEVIGIEGVPMLRRTLSFLMARATKCCWWTSSSGRDGTVERR